MDCAFGWLFSAAVLGVILVLATEEEFPGWGTVLAGAGAIELLIGGLAMLLPDGWWWLGMPPAAVLGGLFLAYACHVDRRKAILAAGIYLGLRLLFELLVFGT